MDELKETLKQALAVARAKPQEALDLLEAGLEKARKSGDWRGVSILARHAGVVSTESGDFLGAIKYYDEALSADPEDAYLHFARGDVYRTLGQDEQAHFAFTQSLELATKQGDVDMIKMASEARVRFDDEVNGG
jgi:tetratricopeptide (TPR) repeat protein